VRDTEGRIPLIEKLLNCLSDQEATQFGLDLRSLGIQDGEVDFEDQQTQKVQRTIRFAIDLISNRMRDQSCWACQRTGNLKTTAAAGSGPDFN